ncbi:hypothetical protein CYMTET_32696, partial [Cymbomonas tetramitiformis]
VKESNILVSNKVAEMRGELMAKMSEDKEALLEMKDAIISRLPPQPSATAYEAAPSKDPVTDTSREGQAAHWQTPQ